MRSILFSDVFTLVGKSRIKKWLPPCPHPSSFLSYSSAVLLIRIATSVVLLESTVHKEVENLLEYVQHLSYLGVGPNYLPPDIRKLLRMCIICVNFEYVSSTCSLWL